MLQPAGNGGSRKMLFYGAGLAKVGSELWGIPGSIAVL